MQQSDSGQKNSVSLAGYLETLEHVRILSGRASDLASLHARTKGECDALRTRIADLEKQLNDLKSAKPQNPHKKEPVTLDGVAVLGDDGAQA